MLATISTLSSLNSRVNEIKPLTTIIDTEPIRTIRSLAQDTTGNIWIAGTNTEKTLYKFNPYTNYSSSIVTITTTTFTPQSGLYIDNSNNLFINGGGTYYAIPNFITVTDANAIAATTIATSLGPRGPTMIDSSFGYIFSGGYIKKYGLPMFGESVSNIITFAGNGLNTIATYKDTNSTNGNILATETSINIPNTQTQWCIYNGSFYMADKQFNVIRRVDMTTNYIYLVAGIPNTSDTITFAGDGGPATSCKLYWPSGIAFDSIGNLYICDSLNYRIRVVNTSGIINTLTTIPNIGPAGGPFQLLVDVNNNLIIAANSKLYSYPLS